MRFLGIATKFFAISILSFFMGLPYFINSDDFFLNILLRIPFWVWLFLFFRWDNWVEDLQ